MWHNNFCRSYCESYGAAKQQHTFTIEVLWSKGEKPLPSLYPLLIKGRNLYRLKTLRQKWEDEGERQKVLMEKHSRGSVARSERDFRVQVKEKGNILKANRVSRKGSDRQHSQFDPTSSHQLPQPGLSLKSEKPLQTQNLVSAPNSEMPDLHQQFVLPVNYEKPANNAYHSIAHHPNQASLSERLYIHNHGTQYMFHVNHISLHNGYPAPFNTHLNTNETKGFPERTIHRKLFTSMNKFHPPRRQDGQRQQLCRYYAQGRCYHGDNCKFSHDMREEYG